MEKSLKERGFEITKLASNDSQTKGIWLDFELTKFEIARFDCSISTDNDCCTFAPKIYGKFPKKALPESIS